MGDRAKPEPQPIRKRLLLAGVLSAAGLLLAVGIVRTVHSRRAAPGRGTEPASVPERALASGQELYGTYCAACHGEKGGGDGPAARYLYPKPRNFRDARF